MSAVTFPPGRNGLNARQMAVLSPFRAPALGRHVHRAFLRSVGLDVPPIIPATVCHQRNDVERYSRYMVRQFSAVLQAAEVPVEAEGYYGLTSNGARRYYFSLSPEAVELAERLLALYDATALTAPPDLTGMEKMRQR